MPKRKPTKHLLLHKDSPLEKWEENAAGSGISGEELRRRTLAADAWLETFFSGNTASKKSE